MMPTMHADLYAAIFTSIVAIPWAGWLLLDLFKHERD